MRRSHHGHSDRTEKFQWSLGTKVSSDDSDHAHLDLAANASKAARPGVILCRVVLRRARVSVFEYLTISPVSQ